MDKQRKINNFKKEERVTYNPDLFKHLDSFKDVENYDDLPDNKELVLYFENNNEIGFFEHTKKNYYQGHRWISKYITKWITQDEADKLLKDSVYKIYCDFVKDKRRFPRFRGYKEEEYDIFYHLMEMMEPEQLIRILEHYFPDEETMDKNGFHDFHKSMRQTDFYDSSDPKIGGHLDMVFWSFIYISDAPYLILKEYLQFKKTELENIKYKESIL